MSSVKEKVYQILFLAVSVTAILFGFFLFGNEFRKEAFKISTYYFLLFSFFVWLALVLKDISFKKENLINFWKDNWPGVCLSLSLVILFFVSVQPQFRVVDDEPNIVNLSKMLFLNRTADHTYQGLWFYNGYHSLSNGVWKRPAFFSFLIYIVHTLRGYSAYNGFVVNFAATLFVFVNIYLLIKNIFSHRVALITLILTASYPVVSLCATSSGFEVANLLFLLLSMRYLYDYLLDKTTLKLNKLIFTLVLLAQCRYESAGYVIIVLAIAFLAEWRRSLNNISLLTVVTPLLFLPVAWQRVFAWGWHNQGEKALFSLSYLQAHIQDFLRFFLLPGNARPVAFAVDYIAIAGLAYSLWVLWRSWTGVSRNEKLLFYANLSVLIFYLFAILTELFGNIDHPVAFRFALVFIPYIALMAALLLDFVARKLVLQWYLVVFLICLFAHYHSTAVKNEYVNRNVFCRSYIRNVDFLKKYAADNHNGNMLVIAIKPRMYVIHRGIGSVTFDYANKHKDRIKEYLESGLVNDVIVIQWVDLKDGKPKEGTDIDSSFVLEKLFEIRERGDLIVRYSKITGFN